MSPPAWIGAGDMGGADRLLRVIDALGEAFADLSAGRTAEPSRTVVEHGADRQLVTATATWERRGVGSVKVTTLTPGNPGRGLPLISGVVVLTELSTGRILAHLDGAELTAVRTGAVAGLATRLCAREDATDLALIGAGTQARALVRAMLAVRPIRSVRIFSRTAARAEVFARWIEDTADRPVRVTVCDTARHAVTDAEIICTATSTAVRTPLVRADWVAPGCHLNVVGGTHEDAVEVDPALLGHALVVVESRAAALCDAGEVRAALAAGLIDAAGLHEVGTPVSGWAAGEARTSVFRSVGMALEDIAAAAVLHEEVTGGGLRPAHDSGPGRTARTR